MSKLAADRLKSSWTPLNNQEANYKVGQTILFFCLLKCYSACRYKCPFLWMLLYAETSRLL